MKFAILFINVIITIYSMYSVCKSINCQLSHRLPILAYFITFFGNLQMHLFVILGINIQEEASSDVYLLLERCWGTVYEDPNSLPRYDLIENG